MTFRRIDPLFSVDLSTPPTRCCWARLHRIFRYMHLRRRSALWAGAGCRRGQPRHRSEAVHVRRVRPNRRFRARPHASMAGQAEYNHNILIRPAATSSPFRRELLLYLHSDKGFSLDKRLSSRSMVVLSQMRTVYRQRVLCLRCRTGILRLEISSYEPLSI